MNNSTDVSCVLSHKLDFDLVHVSYYTNAIITLVLTLPAIFFNLLVMLKYYRLRPELKKRNTMFLFFNQAVVDVFNIVVNTTLLTAGNVVYYTDIFQETTNEYYRELSCCYWYVLAVFAIFVSLITSLLVMILIAADRFLSVWNPSYWFSHIRTSISHRRKLRKVVSVIWLVATVFGISGAAVFSEYWFGNNGVHSLRFRDTRTIICLLLTLILVTLWVLTFVKTCYTLNHKPTTKPALRNVYVNAAAVVTNSEVMELERQQQHQQPQQQQPQQQQPRRKIASPLKIITVEVKLVRVFAAMLFFFFIGYIPILTFFVALTVSTGSFSAVNNDVLHVLWGTGTTALALSSVFNPLLVLFRVEHLQFSQVQEASAARRRSSAYLTSTT